MTSKFKVKIQNPVSGIEVNLHIMLKMIECERFLDVVSQLLHDLKQTKKTILSNPTYSIPTSSKNQTIASIHFPAQ